MNIAGIIELVIMLPTGIAFLVLGMLLWKKQKISLIHDYHHSHVQAQDIKAYTRLWGIGLLIMGIGSCLTGIIDIVFHTEAGWIVFIMGFAIGFLIGNKAQKNYNGSWFG